MEHQVKMNNIVSALELSLQCTSSIKRDSCERKSDRRYSKNMGWVKYETMTKY